MPRTPYDVDASWDDPFERVAERRAVARVHAPIRVKIAVNLAHKRAPLVGPGVVEDISPVSFRCRTKQRVAPGQSVRVYISTKGFPPDLGLPKSFLGGAQVVRSNELHDGVYEVAMRFDEDLRDDILLSVFVEHLQSVAKPANA